MAVLVPESMHISPAALAENNETALTRYIESRLRELDKDTSNPDGRVTAWRQLVIDKIRDQPVMVAQGAWNAWKNAEFEAAYELLTSAGEEDAMEDIGKTFN